MLFLHACSGTSQIIPLILADFNCKNYTKHWENTPVVVSRSLWNCNVKICNSFKYNLYKTKIIRSCLFASITYISTDSSCLERLCISNCCTINWPTLCFVKPSTQNIFKFIKIWSKEIIPSLLSSTWRNKGGAANFTSALNSIEKKRLQNTRNLSCSFKIMYYTLILKYFTQKYKHNIFQCKWTVHSSNCIGDI